MVHTSKQSIIDELKENPEDLNLSHVQRLGHLLIEEGFGSTFIDISSGSSHQEYQTKMTKGREDFKPYSATTIYIGCLLMEYAFHHGSETLEFSNEELILLAQAHAEVLYLQKH